LPQIQKAERKKPLKKALTVKGRQKRVLNKGKGCKEKKDECKKKIFERPKNKKEEATP